MQRTLFDFAGKKTATSAPRRGVAGAAPSRSPSAERSPSTPATRKRVRQQQEQSETDITDASPSAPMSVEESSVSVVAVDETSTSVPRPVAPTRLPPAEAVGHGWLADLVTNPAWRAFLQPITAPSWRSGQFQRIQHFLEVEQSKGKVVLPPSAQIFSAFNSCPFADLKVVLLGQDPYHNLHQAHGLCFSVLPGVPLPPSLRNMYKELTTDIPGFQAPTHGYLQTWSEQGMLMLNATLTVEAHSANSHSKTSGWTHFTDAVIAHLSAHHPNRLVFLLWGNYAQQKKKLIDRSRHVVIEDVHPSPLSASRGWFGCRCFSKCNTALREMEYTPMYWQLPLQAPAV